MTSPIVYTLGDLMKKLNEQPGESWSLSVTDNYKTKIVVYGDDPELSGEYNSEEFKEKFSSTDTDTKCMVVVKNKNKRTSNMFSRTRRTPTVEEYLKRESEMEINSVTLGGEKIEVFEVGTNTEDDDEYEIDTSFGEKEIELVMEQVSCSKEEAITSLEKNDGDIVSAIMELT